MPRLSTTIAILLLFIATMLPLAGQRVNEKGSLLNITNFHPRETRSDAQNWDIVQDERGILFFANSGGVLEFDGINWNKIPIPSVARSLDVDTAGNIFVGLGVSKLDFGMLTPDKNGSFVYRSILEEKNLADSFGQYDNIWEVIATEEGTYFQGSNHLFRWKGDSLQFWTPTTSFERAFFIHETLFVMENQVGLKMMQNDRLIFIPNGERFGDMSIKAMIPYDDMNILVVTESDGLFRLSMELDSMQVNSYRHFTDLDNFLSSSTINCAIRINDNKVAFGTEKKGVAIYDQSNNDIQIVDVSSGLQGELINNMYIDRQDNVWLAMGNGLSIIHPESPVTFFGYNSGIKETIVDITRFQDKLVVATATGLKYLDIWQKDRTLPESVYNLLYNIPAFRDFESLGEEWYDLENFSLLKEEFLLASGYKGIYEVDGEFHTELIYTCAPWSAHQSRKYPHRVIIADEGGSRSIYRLYGEWIDEGFIDSIDLRCRIIAEDDDGMIWIGGNEESTCYRVFYPKEGPLIKPEVTVFNSTQGLPSEHVYPFETDEGVVFGTAYGVYKFDPLKDQFYRDTLISNLFQEEKDIHRMSSSPEGDIWIVRYMKEKGFFDAGYIEAESGEWRSEPFKGFSKGVIHGIFHDRNEVTWLGGPDGLFRYDNTIEKDYYIDFNTYLRKVILRGDSIIHNGIFTDQDGKMVLSQPESGVNRIKYRFNRIRFEFAAPLNEDETNVQFRTRLEGFEDAWSDWSTESSSDYTNLKEGEYTFRVQARNMHGHQGSVATYTFVILPPWFRTVPAILLFFFAGIVLLYLIIYGYTQNLRSIIRQRTREIRVQKEQIEQKNEDILSSIQYAKRIQTALLPPGDQVSKILPERFILYRPRDIVSGDYYWVAERNGKVITVTADCTGHGVPGAMMSMLGMAFINEIVIAQERFDPGKMLDILRSQIVQSLRQTGRSGEAQDGMDMALCIFDLVAGEVSYSGANIPLYMIRDGKLSVVKPDKMPIGIGAKMGSPFSSHQMNVRKGDLFYTFSDGYPDQFGGPEGKKFMVRRMKSLLLEIQELSMKDQKIQMEKELDHWMMGQEQVDDILVMGIRI